MKCLGKNHDFNATQFCLQMKLKKKPSRPVLYHGRLSPPQLFDPQQNCKTKNYLKPFKRTRWMCVGWMLLFLFIIFLLHCRGLPKHNQKRGENMIFFSAQKNFVLYSNSVKKCFFSLRSFKEKFETFSYFFEILVLFCLS